MRHPTYKHLEAKLRLGPFSIGQWIQVGISATAAAVFGVYLSPLPTGITTFISILGAGLPLAVSYGAMGLEFSVGQFAAAAWRYWRKPRRYFAGAGRSGTGYFTTRRSRQSRRDPMMDRRREAPRFGTSEPIGHG